MDTSRTKTIKEFEAETMANLEKRIPDDMKKILQNQNETKKLINEVTKTIEETLKIVRNIREKKILSMEALSHLSISRQDMFLTSLSVKVFETNINIDKTAVEFVRDGKPFLERIALSSRKLIVRATNWQIADIVFEATLMFLQAVGIPIPADHESMRASIEVLKTFVETNQVIVEMVHSLVVYNENGDREALFREICNIAYHLFTEGVLIDVLKALYSGLDWFDWAMLIARVTAFIITLAGSGGLALLASLLSAIVNTVKFTAKLVNMNTFTSLTN